MESLLDRVRSTCKAVAERARHARINYDLIPSYARSLPLERVAAPELDASRHYLGHGADTVAFFLTLDAINFGSGYFPHLNKRPGMSGYFTVASSLNDYFKARGPLSASALACITLEDCAGIFNQDLANDVGAELMGLYAAALGHLGRFLLECFDGSFTGLVESAGSSAQRLAQTLIRMPYFDDRASIGDRAAGRIEVAFYKRAQLTAADLSLAFAGRGPGRFDDLDRLTIFADNLVPHVLRMDGVLLYEDRLASRIDAGELIPVGSAEEVEIRASAVHAVELMVEELRRRGAAVTSMALDYLLWNRGQEPYYKQSKPRHRTRTVFY